jgi:hypothetical protein
MPTFVLSPQEDKRHGKDEYADHHRVEIEQLVLLSLHLEFVLSAAFLIAELVFVRNSFVAVLTVSVLSYSLYQSFTTKVKREQGFIVSHHSDSLI